MRFGQDGDQGGREPEAAGEPEGGEGVASSAAAKKATIVCVSVAVPLLIALALAAWSSTDRGIIRRVFVHAAYPIILSLLVAWLAAAIASLRSSHFSIRHFLRQNWFGLAVVSSLTLAVVLSVSGSLRVFGDETDLLAVSKSMAQERTVYSSMMGLWSPDGYHSLDDIVPKRPLVFPGLVSIVHLLTGYRPGNVFLVNGVALFLLLGTVFLITRSRLGTTAAVAATFLIVSQPIVSLTARSGGFDLLNTLCMSIVLILGYRYWHTPTVADFRLLWLSLLVFVNIRYESILWAGLLAGSLLTCGRIRRQDLKDSLYLFAPTVVWLLPTLWQRALTPGRYQTPAGMNLFSLEMLTLHGRELISSQLKFDFQLPYAPPLTLLSLFALLCWLAHRLYWKTRASGNGVRIDPYVLIVGAILSLNLLLFLAHHGGSYVHPNSARLFLTTSVALALFPITLCFLSRRFAPKVLLGVGLVSFLSYHSVAIEDQFSNRIVAKRRMDFVTDYVESLGSRNVVLITETPGRFTVLVNVGAVNHSYAREHAASLLEALSQGLYEDIYVVQEIDPATQQPRRGERLGRAYLLELVREEQLSARGSTRISRVANVRSIEPDG